MSTLTLRHYPLTLSWIANRRDQQIDKAIRRVKIRTSRRHFRQQIRGFLSTIEIRRKPDCLS
ncbi:MAG: hypothetical protein UU08_C0001G0033 [Candidatus Uhrbacteria bacterium GW2011_GWE2_40_58]|nr:MAG: hypothetical protein UT94_C0001G0033 [Candidatus Uhrbacteria bacterium GW2011_GWF2_40_263]KKR68259.1 MAG: hypothetical protein UU08_C0001G0033 [Candidatus Uhrbacteria bacterium GW2011_GWE2_40_58]OGL92060.1 MAG: hypothetical protein A2239_03550 [Candidatus Uhrbacteria bacterium RIFOXYA2_FULL_40_9]OGL97518.1 MAG: hypothetical protein A2332_00255 [Candidatus Uhrbacteria bacterium RIFOXYB2_FULL_41_18]HBK35093.1 hypothetical protein [Candidatus Uhrbacteria bacterium]